MFTVFMNLGKEDEQAGDILYCQNLYNQLVYFYIQSMGKNI